MIVEDSKTNIVSHFEVGDCQKIVASLPPNHFNTCVTSPPYWGLRDYGKDDQLGLENVVVYVLLIDPPFMPLFIINEEFSKVPYGVIFFPR